MRSRFDLPDDSRMEKVSRIEQHDDCELGLFMDALRRDFWQTQTRSHYTHTQLQILEHDLKNSLFFAKKLRKSKIFNSASHNAEEKCFSRFRKESRKKVVHPFFFRRVEGGERKSHTDGGDVIIC